VAHFAGNPPPYEKLLGDLLGSYSRRINIQHRLIKKPFQDGGFSIIDDHNSHREHNPDGNILPFLKVFQGMLT
jgi:hypothetical protein